MNGRNQHQNHQNQRGGRGGGGVQLTLGVSGARNETKISVRLFEGNRPRGNEQVALFAGNDSNPVAVQLTNAADEPIVVTIGDLGIGSIVKDLSGVDPAEYSLLTAVWGNRMDSKPLPSDVKLPSKTLGKTKARLRVMPEDGVIVSATNTYHLSVLTMDERCKNTAPANLRLIADGSVDIKDLVTGQNLATNDTICAMQSEGNLELEIRFAGSNRLQRQIRIIHLGTAEAVVKRLQFR